MLASSERCAALVSLTELIDAGKVTPYIERTYQLDQAPQAMRHLETGNVRGKLVMAIG